MILEKAAPAARRDRTPLLLLSALALPAALMLLTLRLGGTALDQQLLLALRLPDDLGTPIGPLWLRKVMVAITSLGGGIQLGIFVAIAAGLLIVRRAAVSALLLVAATASGAALIDLLKDRFARPRPALVDHLVAVESASFPSAHAANSAIVFLTIGILMARIETSRAERRYSLAVAILLTLLVGASRVYLGVHWPSDVAAGWMIGSAWALIWWTLATTLAGPRR